MEEGKERERERIKEKVKVNVKERIQVESGESSEWLKEMTLPSGNMSSSS